MASNLLTADQVRERLLPLTQKQLERLAELSQVPMPTIYKIKLGVTQNPGLETVGLFWPFIAQAQADLETASPKP